MPSTWRDLKYWDRHVYIGTEANDGIKVVSVDDLDAPVKRVTALDTPMAYAPTLVEAYLPNKDKVVKAVKEVMYI